MGIQGLIPFLQKTSRPINVSQFSGCTVAIDAYCWLHKGAFSCSDKLARGDKTDMYVTYCMKYVNMLLSHNIKPILVFDGRHLPAKADTEKKRRENRELNKRRAAELLRQDKPNEARTYLQRCIDVTHEMALELMQECRRRNVDCVTAPYEADAQLAYLNINNFAHIVITEDSDLLLFGCTKVIFKLDVNGNGLLVEQERLHLSMGVSAGCFSLDKFRHMCILSGCDYLPSLPKIGLAKALRFVKSTVDPDIHRALSRLGGHLNMHIVVPVEYRDKFLAAEAMFRHQPVFDPLSRQIVPLTPLPPGAPPLPLLSDEPLDLHKQLQLALGNLDPFTLKKVDDWSPDSKPIGGKTSSWTAHSIAPHKSIWSPDYKPRALVIERPDPCKVKHTPTSGKVLERSANLPLKRPLKDTGEEINALRSQFGCSQPAAKKQRCLDEDIEDVLELLEKPESTPPKPAEDKTDVDLLESPKKQHSNPFSKSTPNTGNKFSGISKLAQFKKTNVSPTNVVRSRYFCSEGKKSTEQTEDETATNTLKDVGNVIKTQKIEDEKSPFETKSSQKLTDDSINSILTETSADRVKLKSPAKQPRQKENFHNSSLNTNTTFKWKPSLADMFGFKSKSLPSSPAVKSSFVSPLSTNASEISSSTPTEQTPVRRNPFAKVTKAEETVNTIEGESLRDSEPDSLASDPSECQENPFTAVTPKPQLKVGLSKKQSSSCQKSLLSMFAFKPKAKLQR